MDMNGKKWKDNKMFFVKSRTRVTAAVCMVLFLCSFLLSGCGGGASSKGGNCTISIECSTILDHMEDLKETKKEFVPQDGWILKETRYHLRAAKPFLTF